MTICEGNNGSSSKWREEEEEEKEVVTERARGAFEMWKNRGTPKLPSHHHQAPLESSKEML